MLTFYNKLIFILFQNVQRQVKRDPVKATREDINGPTRSHRKNKFSDPKTRVIVVKKITREKKYIRDTLHVKYTCTVRHKSNMSVMTRSAVVWLVSLLLATLQVDQVKPGSVTPEIPCPDFRKTELSTLCVCVCVCCLA